MAALPGGIKPGDRVTVRGTVSGIFPGRRAVVVRDDGGWMNVPLEVLKRRRWRPRSRFIWIRMHDEAHTSHGRFLAGDVDMLLASEALGFIRAGLAVQVPAPGQVQDQETV
jgi:hypothetical protein